MHHKFEKFDRIILGIDPGSIKFGYAIIRQDGSKHTLITKGILNLQNINDQVLKNKKIFEFLNDLLDKYLFDEIAIEQPVYGKDPQAMIKLGRVLGCCIAFACSKGISITEYLPKTIKKAVTGNGNASKQQVAFMSSSILKIPVDNISKTYDDTDAIGVALCHAFNISGEPVMSSKKSWSKFIADNPDRIVG
ncbi:MAG: crossover junction endodeoxyribonuclease RuvC [Bacteroidales bacterium]|jgi:crossover junction endodeoxyribonuclease RuvC